jgi:hypothetical protein
MSRRKKQQLIFYACAGLMILMSLGIFTGTFEKVIRLCKAYIYCTGAELPDKTEKPNDP